MVEERWDRASLGVMVGLCSLKALLQLLVVDRYGYHGDELYFLECGRHLDWGYVDHPPLIPALARLSELLGGGLVVLRLPSVAAGTGTMILTGLLVRLWGGGVWAMAISLLSLLFAPAHLRIAGMLDIPVIEVFLCTATTWCVAGALQRDRVRLWLLAGTTWGLAIMAKHSALLWGVALLAGLLASSQRRILLRSGPWLAALIAVLLALPNLVWQIDNDFVSLDFMRQLRHEVLLDQGRGLFVAGQLLYFAPLAVPVWLAGLRYGFTSAGLATRPFAIAFVLLFIFFFLVGGKPYYLASAYPAVLAAGGILLEQWFAQRARGRAVFVASFAGTGSILALLSLPILPLQRLDAVIDALLGSIVPPIALTHDLHGMYGWPEHAGAVVQVYRALAERERAHVTVLTGSYSQAAAVNMFAERSTPRAVSGHMTYYLWGPGRSSAEVLIAYGLPTGLLTAQYGSCSVAANIEAPLARPWDTHLPVYLCRNPKRRIAEFWPELRNFGHRQLIGDVVR